MIDNYIVIWCGLLIIIYIVLTIDFRQQKNRHSSPILVSRWWVHAETWQMRWLNIGYIGKISETYSVVFHLFLAFYVNSFRVGIYKESYLNLESKTYLQRIYTPYLLFPPKEYQIPHLWQKNRKDKDKIQGKRKFPTYLFTLKNEWVNQRANPFFPPTYILTLAAQWANPSLPIGILDFSNHRNIVLLIYSRPICRPPLFCLFLTEPLSTERNQALKS